MTLGIGIHPGIAMKEYLSDNLTPEPALSSSGIRTLFEETPAHFAARNPRLSDWPMEDDSTKETDLGTIVHGLILGCGGDFCVIDPTSFRNKDGSQAKNFNNADAKAAKQQAEDKGLIVITPAVNRQATMIADRASEAILKRYGHIWESGVSEATMIWQRFDGLWCRARVDRLNDISGYIFDIKTTSRGLAEFGLASKFAGEGTDIQAAHYIDGLEAIRPELAGRIRFVIIALEVEPPYEIRFLSMPSSTIAKCQQIVDLAALRLAACLAENRWPGYEDGEGGERVLPVVEWREKRLESAVFEAEAEEALNG